MNALRLAVLLATMAMSNATVAFEVVHTAAGKLGWVENGWFGEGIAFSHTVSTTGCGTATEYAISKDHPSYRELTSMLFSAYSAGKNVLLVVETGVCLFGGRTKVLAICMQ